MDYLQPTADKVVPALISQPGHCVIEYATLPETVLTGIAGKRLMAGRRE